MDETPVVLKVKPGVKLPQRVVLPMALYRRYGLDRQFVIARREQEVPPDVAAWLRRDHRYADWFDPTGLVPQAVTVTVTDASGGQQVAQIVVTPAGAGSETTNGAGEKEASATMMAFDADEGQAGDESGEARTENAALEDALIGVNRAAAVAAWSESDNIPALREYAKLHGVELTSEDKKADVVAKLRAAGLPERSS